MNWARPHLQSKLAADVKCILVTDTELDNRQASISNLCAEDASCSQSRRQSFVSLHSNTTDLHWQSK